MTPAPEPTGRILSPAVRDRIAAARRASGGARAASGIARRAEPGGPARLSPAQERLWFLAQLDPDSAAYNVPTLVRLRGGLDAGALLAAVRDLAGRHQVLRSRFAEVDGEPAVIPGPAEAVPLTLVDLTERPAALDASLIEASRRPFVLAAEPPLRAALHRLGADDHVLALIVHHIAFDGWSRDVALADLAALYRARVHGSAPPPSPSLQYADYADWIASPDRADRAEADVDWWVTTLSGLEPLLDIPADRPRPAVADWTGGEVPVRLTAAVTAGLRRFAADTGGTPFMVLLAVWQELLGRLAQTDDVAVGVPEAGRRHPDTEGVIGCFVNTLVMRTDLSGEPSGRQLVARVREVVLDAFAHGAAPFERIVARLRPARDLATTPVFQAMLNVRDSPAGPRTFAGLEMELREPAEATAKFDLNLALDAVGAAGERMEGSLAYRTDLFDRATAERMAGWFVTLLRGAVGEPDRPVRDIALESWGQGPRLSGPRRDFDLSAGLAALIGRSIAARPEATAVVGPDRTLTYRELDARAARVAGCLLAAGVRPGQPVGVLTERRTPLVAAFLGVLRAGGVYVPMDPAHPDDRLAGLAAAAGTSVVLAERAAGDRVRARLESRGTRLVVLDEILDETPGQFLGLIPGQFPGRDAAPARPGPPVTVTPDSAAYILFTSGSTGRPKGVVVENRQIVHYLAAVSERVRHLGVEGGSFALVSTHAADLGLTSLLVPLTTCGAVHLIDRETAADPAAFTAYLAAEAVDVVKMVPSHLEMLAAHGDLATLLPGRLLILAGEPCPWQLIRRVELARPDLAIQVHYGPSETTVTVLGCPVEEVPESLRSGVVPLGRPFANADCYIVDAAGRPVPDGLPGELWIGGPGVARGYLGADELTAERFVPAPAGGASRCYRSGDRVRLNGQGLVEFLGRTDDQVKIRGYRVEPGEIVALLREQDEIAEAVVLPVGDGRSRRLVAWVTSARRDEPVDIARVRAALRAKLPDYLVPAAIVELPALPLNPNGKVDRAALPAPREQPAVSSGPGTPGERRLCGQWARALDLDPGALGVDDDFFALGGDSFLAVRLIRDIDPRLRVIDLFTHPTIRELAAFLDAMAAPAAGTGLLHRLAGPPPGRDASMTIVCVPYGGGSAAAFAPLATALRTSMPDAVVLAVEPPGHDAARPGERLLALPRLVGVILAELAAGSRQGPVLVYGHCVGSAAAAELALRLEEAGVPVAGLIVGGSFPGARLPGRIADWARRRFSSTRWISDRAYRDFLRSIGGLDGDEDPAFRDSVLRGTRHDVEEAEAWFANELTRQDRRTLRAPVLCVVGEKDRVTELYQERYAEWGMCAGRVELAVLPRAGHFFLRHQATALAATISASVQAWAEGRLPEPVAEVPVVGPRARHDLRAFYTVAAGQTASLIGSALTSFALGVWAYQRSGRVTDYAVVTMLALLPAIVLAPAGGAITDRVERRRVLLACDAVSAVFTACLVLSLWTGHLALWGVALIVGAESSVNAARRPAYLAAVTQLVPKPYLPQANAIASFGTGMGMLISPLIGGALIGLIGLPWVIALDVASFLAGLGTLLAVRFPARLFRHREETFGRAILGGCRYLLRRPPLMIMIGYFMVENYFGTLALALTVPTILSFASTASVGVVTALSGLGAVAGSVAMALWGGTARRATGMVGFVIGVGLGVLLVGLRPSVVLAGIGGLIWWGSLSILNAHWIALIQVKVGLELQGRVLAANQMMALAMAPVAFLTAGPLTSYAGTWSGRGSGLLLVICGAFLAVWGALGLCWRPLHRMEDVLPDAASGAEIAADLDAVQAEADLRIGLARRRHTRAPVTGGA